MFINPIPDSTQHLLGLNTNAFSKQVVHDVATRVFDKIEKEMSKDTQVTEELRFCITLGNPGGMPWPALKEGDIREDNGRRCFIFQVGRSQLPRLKNC